MTPFHIQRFVEFSDTDMAGIMHFSNFFRYMEGAEHAFLRSKSLSVVMTWEGEHLAFPRVSATCDYLKPVRFEETLDIEVCLERIGGKSLTYLFTFRHQDQIVAQGKIVCVCCQIDPVTRHLESMDLPESLKRKLRDDPPNPNPNHWVDPDDRG